MRLAREPTTMPLPSMLTPILVVVSPVYGEIQVEDRNINVGGVNYWFSSSKKEKCFPDEFHRFLPSSGFRSLDSTRGSLRIGEMERSWHHSLNSSTYVITFTFSSPDMDT